MKFDSTQNFRTVWNKFSAESYDKLPKRVTKEYGFVLQVSYVLGKAFSTGIEVRDECAILKALADMEDKEIPLSFSRLMIHKTIFD